MASVNERMSYGGNQDYRLIDEVLLFRQMSDAGGAEGDLHAHFSDRSAFGRFSRNADFPLAGNGQSELYFRDVLGLDDNYSWRQAFKTWLRVQKVTFLGRAGEFHWALVYGRALCVLALAIALLTVLLPVKLVITAFEWYERKRLGKKAELSEHDHRIDRLLEDLQRFVSAEKAEPALRRSEEMLALRAKYMSRDAGKNGG
ncbi:hypothetical protein [Pseudomonas fluorescens]|nr:hypothetical protein [Pseudomonas fluorescens]